MMTGFQSTIASGDYVTFRRNAFSHRESGRCVGLSCHRSVWSYDVETGDGDRVNGVRDVALDFGMEDVA